MRSGDYREEEEGRRERGRREDVQVGERKERDRGRKEGS